MNAVVTDYGLNWYRRDEMKNDVRLQIVIIGGCYWWTYIQMNDI